MLFSSSVFLFQFLPAVLLVFFLMKNYRSRLWVLLISSLIFYGYWNVNYIGLLFFSILVDFFIGIKLEEEKSERKRKIYLWASVGVNLGILFVFKYFNFFVGSIQGIGAYLGIPILESVKHSLILPIGISFYTFQSMSYTIDIYRKHTKAHRDFVAFFTYVSFFPQLIAGPIIRYSELLPQLEANSRLGNFNKTYVLEGIYFFVVGLAKKILIADRIGATIDPILGNMTAATGMEAWLCMFGYAFQLYFDFSGYSDMAVGLGKFFHLDFPRNFNSPYKSFSVTEFWKRWHISLSSWLRDYLYISLGGNRYGLSKTYRNLLITMLLGGLWHGAGWTFVVWGALHGIALAVERYSKEYQVFSVFPRVFKGFSCFLFVCFAWVFFRAQDLEHAYLWILKMLRFEAENFLSTPNIPGRFEGQFYLAFLVAIIASFCLKNTFEKVKDLQAKTAYALAVYLILSFMFLRSESAFLYFQF